MATTTTTTTTTIPPPPRDLEEIASIDKSLIFPSFTASTAWALGTTLRQKLATCFPSKPAVIDISLAWGQHCLFHSVTGPPGTGPDNDSWVARKRNTVLRFGVSSWYMQVKMGGDERAFAEKYALERREYAIHGGGWPVKVEGVEGVVAVVVVSGLKQEEDHGVVVEGVREVLGEMRREKEKEEKEGEGEGR
ncbi:hypothetical protein F4778DRAFT_775610 [Xylariomycetidae sp. FL2044]|nr:hypothetical protein F4778DRAFT_775610 [Xylariomycetidae sp. FL2044]